MDKEQFHNLLFLWWENNKREFPWRNTSNPYFITISEFMLQQTQANRVVPKYRDFLQNFPTMQDLVMADISKVIKTWQGLGYNRRAIWLKECITKICELGSFPTKPEELIKYKGIGLYTSRAIPIFAFNSDIVTVDTNIKRILIYHGFASEKNSEKELFEIARKLLPRGRSREYHNALMDYGAIEITPSLVGIKSKTNQTKYKGSKREARGKIIKKLTSLKSGEGMTFDKVTSYINRSDIVQIIKDLESDGLIIVEDKSIRLP